MKCKKNKVLIIGGSGYIGGNLSSLLGNKHEVFSTYFTNKDKVISGKAIHLDVTDRASVKRTCSSLSPDIVYLLAYSLDDMEKTIVRGASHVMDFARDSKTRIIYLSTDVVFSGAKQRYYENDIPDAINEYGKAKCKAERIVLENGGFVVRTSLVYGFDPMDVRTSQLLNDLKEGDTTTAYFYDEFRCPIFVLDLCNMLVALADIDDAPRILHMAGPECMSRLEFARRLASAFGFDINLVRSATLKDSGLIRPGFLSLDSSLAQEVLNYRICSLDEALGKYAVNTNNVINS